MPPKAKKPAAKKKVVPKRNPVKRGGANKGALAALLSGLDLTAKIK